MMRSSSYFSRLALAVAVASLLSLSAVARTDQKITRKDVPAAVLEAFQKAYPKATVRGYAKEEEDGKVFYEIESIEGNTSRDVLFNPDGTIVEVEESIAGSALPEAALQTIRKQYPNAAIKVAEKVTRNNTVGYEVKVKQGKKVVGLAFDSEGKLLKSGGK